MTGEKPKQAERNVGAFLGPDVLVPVPMRTLGDDYHDEPAQPEDSDREPEAEPPGAIKRVLDRLTGQGSKPKG